MPFLFSMKKVHQFFLGFETTKRLRKGWGSQNFTCQIVNCFVGINHEFFFMTTTLQYLGLGSCEKISELNKKGGGEDFSQFQTWVNHYPNDLDLPAIASICFVFLHIESEN